MSQMISQPSQTKKIIDRYQLKLKKSLGQNFLTDGNILKKMISAAGIDSESSVLEIGPGIGSLTEYLAQHAQHVVAIEIDQRLIPILHDVLHEYKNVKVVHGDFLALALDEFTNTHFPEDSSIKLVANLPYYITTPIVMKIIESKAPIDTIVIMMQKEVAERMMASPNSKNYGSLSIAIQFYMHVEKVINIPRTVFIPQPNVDSIVLKLTRHSKPLFDIEDEEGFFEMVRAAFSQRRKTILNNLGNYKSLSKETWLYLFDSTNISPQSRAESLQLYQFVHLYHVMQHKISHS